MQEIIKHFVRSPGGEWLCTSTVEFQSEKGRVQVVAGMRFKRGTVFMGLEIARLLDEQEEKTRPRR